MQPPYQPATPQQPAPKPGQPNYPNIEKFNEEEWGSKRKGQPCPYQPCDYEIEQYGGGSVFREHCKETHPEIYTEMMRVEDLLDDDTAVKCPECRGTGMKPSKTEEPDPSNPDKELNPDPDIPEPVEPDEDGKEKEPFDGKPVTTEGLEVPDKVEIPERLYNDLMMMIEYSVSNDNEAGGFLIVAEHGNIGVVGEQFGKDREIVLEPNEALHEGESLIGTVHMHPVTPTASTGDVSGYLNDENEKVMVVVGQDKSINFYFKTPFTAEGDYGDEISDNFEQEDMDMLAEGFGFIWYRGEESDRTELHLMSNTVDNVELNIVEDTWPVEDLIKGIGIKGRPDIPEDYSQKKTPLKLQIPFSFKCNDHLLKG